MVISRKQISKLHCSITAYQMHDLYTIVYQGYKTLEEYHPDIHSEFV